MVMAIAGTLGDGRNPPFTTGLERTKAQNCCAFAHSFSWSSGRGGFQTLVSLIP